MQGTRKVSDRTESVVLIAHSGRHDRELLQRFLRELQDPRPSAPPVSPSAITAGPQGSGGG